MPVKDSSVECLSQKTAKKRVKKAITIAYYIILESQFPNFSRKSEIYQSHRINHIYYFNFYQDIFLNILCCVFLINNKNKVTKMNSVRYYSKIIIIGLSFPCAWLDPWRSAFMAQSVSIYLMYTTSFQKTIKQFTLKLYFTSKLIFGKQLCS